VVLASCGSPVKWGCSFTNSEESTMAIPRKIPLDFAAIFPFGTYMVGEISPVRDFDRSTRENLIQATDPDTGILLWAADVVDADPDANKSNRTMTVKVSAKVQPVLGCRRGHASKRI
jgi:hypothetical protein